MPENRNAVIQYRIKSTPAAAPSSKERGNMWIWMCCVSKCCHCRFSAFLVFVILKHFAFENGLFSTTQVPTKQSEMSPAHTHTRWYLQQPRFKFGFSHSSIMIMVTRTHTHTISRSHSQHIMATVHIHTNLWLLSLLHYYFSAYYARINISQCNCINTLMFNVVCQLCNGAAVAAKALIRLLSFVCFSHVPTKWNERMGWSLNEKGSAAAVMAAVAHSSTI